MNKIITLVIILCLSNYSLTSSITCPVNTSIADTICPDVYSPVCALVKVCYKNSCVLEKKTISI